MKSKIIFLFLAIAMVLQSCYKTEGPEYYDELDVSITTYDTKFDFSSRKTVIVNDTVALRHDYLTNSQVDEFYSINGASNTIVAEIKAQFRDKGYEVKGTNTTDASFFNNADLFVNPVLMLSQTTDIMYWPGYGWGGYYYGWGWGSGYYGYYAVGPTNSHAQNITQNNTLENRNTEYYDYGYGGYYPGWGWGWGGGGYSQHEYETGTLTMEMAEGQSVRDYWDWFVTHTPEEIQNYPDSVPPLKMVWKAFIEGQLSGDNSYDDERGKRGFDEAFEQSYYLNK